MYSEEKILCLMCENASLSKESLLEHIYEHLGYKRHACHTCDYASSSLEDIMRHGDDRNHATKLFGFRREYLDRVSEIVYKDCIDAQKRGIDAMMKCTVVRGTDEDSKRLRSSASTSLSTAINEGRDGRDGRVTPTAPDSTDDAVPTSTTKVRASKKTKKELNNTSSPSSSKLRSTNDEQSSSSVCKKCKVKVSGGVDQMRRHAYEHLRNVCWRCSYCLFRTSEDFAKLTKHAARKHPGCEPLDICDCVEDDDAVEIMTKCFPDISRQRPSDHRPVTEFDQVAARNVSPPPAVSSSPIADSSSAERRIPRSSSATRIVSQPTPSSTLADSMSTDGSGSTNTAAHKIFCNECGASVSSLYGAKRSHVAIKHLACDSAAEVDEADTTFVQMMSHCFPGTTSLTDLQCLQCGKEYASEGGRQGHVARKHYVRYLQCPFTDCRYRATYTDDVSRHIKNEHQRGRGKEQIPREVALRWEWDRKAFQANLLPQVHLCFPQPLPDKDRRRPASPTPIDFPPSDNALLQLMSDVRQSLQDDTPAPSPTSVRKRSQSESVAQPVISSTPSKSAAVTSLSSARMLVASSSTSPILGINNIVSAEAYLPEEVKPTPFLTASSRGLDDSTTSVCVTKEKIKKRRVDQAERPTIAAQVAAKESENRAEERTTKQPMPLLGPSRRSPLLGDRPQESGCQLPLLIDTSHPPPHWRPGSATGYNAPIPLPTEPKFSGPHNAYSPNSYSPNSTPSPYQQDDARNWTNDSCRPAPAYGGFTRGQPQNGDSYRHRSTSGSRGSSFRGRSQSRTDRQENLGGPPSERFPHSVGGRRDDHRRPHPPSSGFTEPKCRLCKKTVSESDVECHLWTVHVDAHFCPYKCRVCKYQSRTIKDIMGHARSMHKLADKSSILVHTATANQRAKFEAQKRQCFPDLRKR